MAMYCVNIISLIIHPYHILVSCMFLDLLLEYPIDMSISGHCYVALINVALYHILISGQANLPLLLFLNRIFLASFTCLFFHMKIIQKYC